jgi:hypothetical protein
MAEEIQKLKFIVDTTQLSEANIELKTLDNTIKKLETELQFYAKWNTDYGQQKRDAIKSELDLQNKAKDALLKNIKETQKEQEKLAKVSKETTEVSTKGFKKMAFLILGVAGAGRGLVTFLRKLFKESEAFKVLNIYIGKFGTEISKVIDKGLKPFIKNLQGIRDIEIEKTLKKTEESAISNIASFEILTKKLNDLGKILKPSVIDQKNYAKAVEELKSKYPEYLGYMSTEITNHKENNKLIELQRDLLYNQIVEKVKLAKTEELLKDQIQARLDIKKAEIEIDATRKKMQEYENTEDNTYYTGLWLDAIDKLKDAKTRDEKATKELVKTDLEYQAVLKDIKKTEDAGIKTVEDAIAIQKEEKELKKELSDFDKDVADEEKRLWDISQKEYEERAKKVKEYTETEAEAQRKIRDEQQKTADKNAELTEKQIENGKKLIASAEEQAEAQRDLYFKMANNALQIGTELNRAELQDVDNKYKEEADKYAEMLEKNQITKEEYDTAIKKLENKAAKEKTKILKQQQKIDIAMAVVSTAQATLNAFNSKDAIFMWQKITYAALAAALGAAQISTIAKQKFQEGGLAVGPSHSEGGIQGNVKGRPIEFEGGEIIAKKEVNEDPYTRDIVNYAQVLKKGRRIPNSRNVKGIMIDYGSRQHYLTGSGRGLPSLSSMTFAEGGSTGAISPTSSSVASPITVNIPQSKTELIPFMKGNDLFIKMTTLQNKYKNAGGNLEDIG